METHAFFHICRKRSSFDWLCTPVLCPTTGFEVTTDCSKHPEKPSLSVVGCSGGDGFCDLAGGLLLALFLNLLFLLLPFFSPLACCLSLSSSFSSLNLLSVYLSTPLYTSCLSSSSFCITIASFLLSPFYFISFLFFIGVFYFRRLSMQTIHLCKYFDKQTQKGFLPGISGCVEHACISQEALRDARRHRRSICFNLLALTFEMLLGVFDTCLCNIACVGITFRLMCDTKST